MEQRIENSEVFRLTDDQSAEWAVRKIREARRDTEQWEAHFAGQMERIRKAIEEDRYEEFRRDFFNHYDMSRNF